MMKFETVTFINSEGTKQITDTTRSLIILTALSDTFICVIFFGMKKSKSMTLYRFERESAIIIPYRPNGIASNIPKITAINACVNDCHLVSL